MPEMVDSIFHGLMDDPDFSPREGQPKDEAAWAVAWARYKQLNKNDEVLSMNKLGYGSDPSATNYSPQPMKHPSPAKEDFPQAIQDVIEEKEEDPLVEVVQKDGGLRPPRPGLKWKELTHRWTRGDNGDDGKSALNRAKKRLADATKLLANAGKMAWPERTQMDMQREYEDAKNDIRRYGGNPVTGRSVYPMSKESFASAPPRPGLQFNPVSHRWIRPAGSVDDMKRNLRITHERMQDATKTMQIFGVLGTKEDKAKARAAYDQAKANYEEHAQHLSAIGENPRAILRALPLNLSTLKRAASKHALLKEGAKSPFAVATAQAKKEGHTDFSEGTPGRERRDEIAEAIKE